MNMLRLQSYQEQAKKTAIYPESAKLFYPSLGLCGEAGEIANKTKKILRDDNGVISEEKKNELAAEIGDCLWYIAALCNDLGLNLGDIAQENLNKLNDRKNRGVIKGSGDTR